MIRLPRHLSVSSVQLYARCPAQWYRRYVEKIVDPKTPPMAFGIAFGKGLEAHHRGLDGDTAFVREHAVQGMPQPGAEHGLRLLELYRERYSFVGSPEQKFSLFLPDRHHVPAPILGFMDLETETEVVEFKTARVPWTQARADAEFQSAVYGWAFHRRHGRRPLSVRYIVFSTKTVSIQDLATYPTALELRLFELAAGVMWKGLKEDRFEGCGRCQVCRPVNSDDEPTFAVTTIAQAAS